MTTPGRNDPCPCRSGKKFKHCCLRARDAALETPGTLAWRRLRRAVDDFAMGKTLLEFVVTTYGPRAADEAWAECSGLEEPFDAQTPHLALFMSWLFHRWSPDPHDPSSTVSAALHERIPTQLVLEHAGRRLDPVVRRYLEGCLAAPFSFHEVLRCDPGCGFNARDLFTGEERDILERSATRGMEPGDIVFGQLVQAEGITMLECAGSCFIPPIRDRKSTRLNSSHGYISNAVFCLKKKMEANKYAILQITRRRFLNEWEAFKKVISRRNIRRRITIPLTLSNLKLLRRITRTENILHRNFTRRQVAIQNRVASNIGISQSSFSVKVLNLFSRSRRKTNKRKSKHSAMLRNKETRHRMFIGLLNTTRKLA